MEPGRLGGTEEETPATTKPYPCPMCDASFETKMQRQGHISGKHLSQRKKLSREEDLQKKRERNAIYRARNRAKGLRADGRPFIGKGQGRKPKFPSDSPEYRRERYLAKRGGVKLPRKVVGASTRRKISDAMKKRWQSSLDEQPQNGYHKPEPPQLDFHSAADKIISAAQTLMHVAMGERMP